MAKTQNTAQRRIQRTRTPGNTLPRFSIYRLARRFTGPVLAYRLAFAGRAA